MAGIRDWMRSFRRCETLIAARIGTATTSGRAAVGVAGAIVDFVSMDLVLFDPAQARSRKSALLKVYRPRNRPLHAKTAQVWVTLGTIRPRPSFAMGDPRDRLIPPPGNLPPHPERAAHSPEGPRG